jgi:hypothetical protein
MFGRLDSALDGFATEIDVSLDDSVSDIESELVGSLDSCVIGVFAGLDAAKDGKVEFCNALDGCEV